MARGGTGCAFAAAFAKAREGPIFWAELGGVKPDQLDALDLAFARAAGEQLAVGVVFPWVRTEADIIEIVAAVASRKGWHVGETPERPRRVPPDAGLVTITWQAPEGRPASTMALGPFGWMPIHRRAPYFTLMSWTGGRHNGLLMEALQNDHARPDGFVDMPIPTAHRAGYEQMWKQSRANAIALRAQEPASNRTARPTITLVLSPGAMDDLRVGLADDKP